jgi:hypothetical protein
MLRTIILLTVATAASGQWIGYKEKNAPRGRDGKVNLTAPAPKVGGKPDLTGIWVTVPAKYGEAEEVIPGVGVLAVPGDDPATISKYFFSVLADNPEVQVTAAGERARVRPDPSLVCLPISPPMSEGVPMPRRIIQTSDLIAMLYEGVSPRQIHLDGRPLPVDPMPTFTGYSIGRWEKDVLVVESSGFNPRMPLDGLGHPRSVRTRLIERIRRPDFGHLEIDVTIEDAEYYSRPIHFRYRQVYMPDDDLIESVCTENEKDAKHMVKP